MMPSDTPGSDSAGPKIGGYVKTAS